MIFSTLLNAQIKIKSRVEIKPAGNQLQNSLNKSGSLPPTSYIANCSGTYLAWVIIAAKNSPPSEGPITVAFRDKVRDTTMVFRLSDYINYRYSYSQGQECDFCNRRPDWSCTSISETAYHAYSTDPELFIMIPYILKGDTLNFSYDNCTQPVKTGAGMEFQFAKRDSIGDKCYSYMEGDLQELELCGIEFAPIRYSVWQDEDTLISGSSTMLYIYTPMDFGDDSLMTIEVDSAQYAKFIYDKGTSIDTLDSPMDSVKCSDAMSGKIKFLAMGKQPDKPVPVAICARYMFDPSKVFEDTIVVKGSEIMLGETKYYYATQETNGELTIHETVSTELPAGAVSSDIWGNNPVAPVLIENKPSGRKLGVYWEKKYPIYTGNTFTSMEDLPTGMIRLVGRYWHKDSVYIVKLTTGNYPTPTSLGIEVKKPTLLGTSDFARARNNGLDINGHPYSVDSVCIMWGGIFGFPPQNIKGQYERESFFEDVELHAYTPGYRYEPWSAEFWPDVQNLRTTSHFWVTSQSMGNGDGVPTHQNTRYMSYVNPQQYVWDLIDEYSTIVHDTPPNEHGYSLFGSFHQSDGRLTFIYPRATGQYNIIHRRVYRQMHLNNNVENYQANLRVRAEFIEFMSTIYFGGLSTRVAQSRLASSYGPLQTMYTTALGEGYQNGIHNTPENLNDLNIFFPLAMAHHITLLIGEIGEVDANNWESGFEETMRIVYNGWNDTPGYDAQVLRYSRKYLPTP
jgi:hypothetical protein